MIESYLDELAQVLELQGLQRQRALNEVADHLRDAARDYEAAGLERLEAERRAVEDFGPPDVVAAAYVTASGGDADIAHLRSGRTVEDLIPLKLEGVRVIDGDKPIVLLKDLGASERLLCIWIGATEATAIAFALADVATARPMTHDLIGNLLHALDGVTPERLVITRHHEGIFFAELQLTHDGETVAVDCRPSDGIAVAARLGLPIFASPSLEPEFTEAA